MDCDVSSANASHIKTDVLKCSSVIDFAMCYASRLTWRHYYIITSGLPFQFDNRKLATSLPRLGIFRLTGQLQEEP
jgi:hypothetical protein